MLRLYLTVTEDGQKKGCFRERGHAQGSKVVEQICEDAFDLGIKYLTVYAFSTENWKRPQSEVDALMKLLDKYLKNCIERSTKNNMRVRVIGDISALDEKMQEKIVRLEDTTKDNTGLNFTVALNYGSRDEMLRAVKGCVKSCMSGETDINDIDESLFESYLDTKGIPDPDLLNKNKPVRRDFLISFYGSLHIRNFILRMFYGLILIKKSLKRLLIIMRKETEDMAECNTEEGE